MEVAEWLFEVKSPIFIGECEVAGTEVIGNDLDSLNGEAENAENQ